MKSLLLAVAFVFAIPAAGQAQESAVPTKLFASAAEVDAALAKAKAEHKGDNTNTAIVLVSVGPYPVQLEYRTGTTAPSVHKGRAELIYVVQGGCTLVTGGTLEGAKEGKGGNMSGTAIRGGSSRKVSKGDYILVPPDTPHWYTEVRGTFVSVTLHMPMTAGQ
jgi:mannose-6-phosphate isomerase-like protein (cupin superfamily)